MNRTAALSILLVASLLTVSSAKPRSTSTILRIYADKNSDVHIVLNNGKEGIVPDRRDQVGMEDAKVADDGRTAGWLGLYPNPANDARRNSMTSLGRWSLGAGAKSSGPLIQDRHTGAGPFLMGANRSPTIAVHYMMARPHTANCAT